MESLLSENKERKKNTPSSSSSLPIVSSNTMTPSWGLWSSIKMGTEHVENMFPDSSKREEVVTVDVSQASQDSPPVRPSIS
ncbi:unnamed protein product [Brassica rapa]|uniref:Uncharacterized protein n=2 Tax=Brassica TaxID=3705 RepID=A0A8D9HAW7_BRACM|nr:unnamed protein product [Brassica napus]CAG7896328.1 unnamed protein product [Brassica rapa]